jgi:hypothetical protein
MHSGLSIPQSVDPSHLTFHSESGDISSVEAIIFIAEKSPDGGYTATAVGHGIFTEADDVEQLLDMALDAVRCHFDDPPPCVAVLFPRT